MSSPSSRNPVKPLSVGDVVSAGVRIYRSNLKPYLKLSLFAYLWVFVPIYGWAKYAEISARISRLAFRELINQPESLAEAARQTQPRKWEFLVAGLLMVLIFMGIYVGVVIAMVLLIIVGAVIASLAPDAGTTMIPLVILVGVLMFLAIIVLFIRIFARLFILEVPLAIEDNLDGPGALNRTWRLTNGAVGRIQWIAVVAFLITLFIQIQSQVVSVVLPVEDVAPVVALLSFTIIMLVSIVSGMLVLPFWQVIKAVVYYDLRARREGLGLNLRRR